MGGINATALPEGRCSFRRRKRIPLETRVEPALRRSWTLRCQLSLSPLHPPFARQNQSAYVVAGGCSENGVSVTVMIAAITVVPAPICASGAWIGAATNVASLPDGVVVVAATRLTPQATQAAIRVTPRKMQQAPASRW